MTDKREEIPFPGEGVPSSELFQVDESLLSREFLKLRKQVEIMREALKLAKPAMRFAFGNGYANEAVEKHDMGKIREALEESEAVI